MAEVVGETSGLRNIGANFEIPVVVLELLRDAACYLSHLETVEHPVVEQHALGRADHLRHSRQTTKRAAV